MRCAAVVLMAVACGARAPASYAPQDAYDEGERIVARRAESSDEIAAAEQRAESLYERACEGGVVAGCERAVAYWVAKRAQNAGSTELAADNAARFYARLVDVRFEQSARAATTEALAGFLAEFPRSARAAPAAAALKQRVEGSVAPRVRASKDLSEAIDAASRYPRYDVVDDLFAEIGVGGQALEVAARLQKDLAAIDRPAIARARDEARERQAALLMEKTPATDVEALLAFAGTWNGTRAAARASQAADDAAFANAKETGSATALAAYRGRFSASPHADEARSLEADARLKNAGDNVEALVSVAHDYPGTQAGARARAAAATLLLDPKRSFAAGVYQRFTDNLTDAPERDRVLARGAVVAKLEEAEAARKAAAQARRNEELKRAAAAQEAADEQKRKIAEAREAAQRKQQCITDCAKESGTCRQSCQGLTVGLPACFNDCRWRHIRCEQGCR